MYYSPSSDMAAGPIIAMVFAMGIGALLAIILIEAAILTKLKWKNFWPSVLASFSANIASALAGFFLVDIFGQLTSALDKMGIEWSMIIIFFIGSALIEAIVLWLFKRASLRETALAALAMNAASYALIILPMFIFLRIL